MHFQFLCFKSPFGIIWGPGHYFHVWERKEADISQYLTGASVGAVTHGGGPCSLIALEAVLYLILQRNVSFILWEGFSGKLRSPGLIQGDEPKGWGGLWPSSQWCTWWSAPLVQHWEHGTSLWISQEVCAEQRYISENWTRLIQVIILWVMWDLFGVLFLLLFLFYKMKYKIKQNPSDQGQSRQCCQGSSRLGFGRKVNGKI